MEIQSMRALSTDLTAEDLRAKIDRLQEQLSKHRRLEAQMKQTLQELHVHQEELRTQNEDLITAQREIADAHAKYLDLFDYAPNGYFLINADGIVTEVNLTAAGLLGRPRSAIIGKPLWIFVHESVRDHFNVYLRTLWRGGNAVLELNLLQSAGGQVPVELHGVPVRNLSRSSEFFRIAAIDVTRRKSAEKALLQANQWLDSILTGIPDIVYRLNEKGAVTFISSAIRKYGFEPEDFINKSFLNLVHPKDRTKAYHRLNEKRKDERHTKGLEIRLLYNQNGSSGGESSEDLESVFSVHAVGLYVRNGAGEQRYIGTQGIAHDITERKRHERAQQELKEQLQRARRMEAIGTLAGGIAHNFNNLLMGIQGNVSLLRCKQYEKEEADDLLTAVEECVQRGSDMIRHLLGFARGGKYVVQPTDVNTILRSVLAMFRPTRKDIEIVEEFFPELWLVQTDQGQMEQVFLNLFINAGQAMPQGGTLKITTRNCTIDKHQAERNNIVPGDFIEIVVKDSGIGMDEKTRNRIFEPFFSTKPIGRGTGLGLASVYGIVENHGGAIQVRSSVGLGTTFAVLFPSDKEATIENNQLPSPQIEKGHGVILVVEDEKVLTEMVAQMLTTLGYAVKTAADEAEAVAVYRAERKNIDLVVLDIILPGVSGLEIYARLKEINPHVKVLFSSGSDLGEQIEQILASDRQQFLQKPFDIEKLSTMIRNVI
jgi:two-component system cell cycle sensor histidine kinase/response regulator CckA